MKARRGIKKDYLIILDTVAKNISYKYYYDKRRDIYHCSACKVKNKYLTATLYHDENGEDYFELNDDKHICKGTAEIPAEKIVKYPNFEIQISKNAKTGETKTLFVADSKNKNLFYKYNFLM
uniref:Uncharacterized protein n=1 Tax=Panagrolaimus sp. ES5 TaxID=591445 RepID=A0AC34FHN2_9BILA